ncbi:cation/H(+) antiporter 15 [Tanacetum coccineum]
MPPQNATQDTIVCYAPLMITTHGIWQGDDPLNYSLPLFLLQLILVVVTTRVLVFLLKPLRQPRVISEILGGVILGPSVMGRSKTFANAVFPLQKLMVHETMQNIGLLYFPFPVGIQACPGKCGTLLVALIYQMPFYDGVTLGLLMNTKGLVEMIVLNVGKDQKVLDEKSFAIMVVVALVMTAIITPAVTVIYKPARRFAPYKRRTILKLKPDSDFRTLVCIHTPRNVPTIINLLEASNPTKKSPLSIHVLHLVELTGRASAMLIVHNSRKSGRPAANRTQAQSDHIINAFETFEQNTENVSVQPVTAISPYSTMHEDICSVAEDKRVSFIILPFHKQQTVDGGMEATNPAYRAINQNVLANPPCSVGIQSPKAFGATTRMQEIRLAPHCSCVSLSTLNRKAVLAGTDILEHRVVLRQGVKNYPGVLTVVTDSDRDKQADDEFINQFKTRIANEDSIVYTEKVVNNGEETVAAIRAVDEEHDLFIVGRGQGMVSPLTAGLTDWSECPELGAIGDLLASSDFASSVSILVIQQYVGSNLDDFDDSPDSPKNQPFMNGALEAGGDLLSTVVKQEAKRDRDI